MTPPVSSREWSEEALVAKAHLYIQKMEDLNPGDWQFGLWSALALEILARASLAHISPVLLAANRDWQNIAYALNLSQTSKKFSPRSLSIVDVLDRLHRLSPEISAEICEFCYQHFERRNSELHSGDLAFERVDVSSWLPQFYLSCKAFLDSMDRDLSDLISDSENAEKMIHALQDKAATKVKKDIEAYKKVWEDKNENEKNKSIERAELWSSRHIGHRVDCPACGSPSILQGSPFGSVKKAARGDNIIQRQAQLPSSFECIACGLRISGFSKLSACGLGDTFTEETQSTIADYFGLYTAEELEDARAEIPDTGFEPDFNE